MLRVGVTGGIGSGKSSLSARLAVRGAHVVDADRVARSVVEPGQPTLEKIRERFGATVVTADGRLDRPALAAVVFADPVERAALDAITHPVIGAEVASRILEAGDGPGVVVVDQPLLDEAGVRRYDLAAVVVVDVDEDVAVGRLVAHRGFTEHDARARIAAQMDRAARLDLADLVVDNSGDEAALDAEADRVWRWLEARAGA